MALEMTAPNVTIEIMKKPAGALFDDARLFRYLLWRTWNLDRPRLAWIMLNPSTADEHVLDPTLRRCQDFSRSWGFGGMTIVNLYALRSTIPSAIYHVRFDPVGEHNDEVVQDVAASHPVVVAWGDGGASTLREKTALRLRADHVVGLLGAGANSLKCLGTTAAGEPKHPLYLAKTTPLCNYRRRQS